MKMLDLINEATPVAPGQQQDMGVDPVQGIQGQIDLAKKQKQDLDKRIRDLTQQLAQAKQASARAPQQQSQQQQRPQQPQQQRPQQPQQAKPGVTTAAAPAGVTQQSVG